ncbi:hypothetical protein BD779DRAFT_1570021 [Infundibulicybe gibba]|nr:hypothetical protein BD779DRAFT_1570021 [Infundibulicybe gibba]
MNYALHIVDLTYSSLRLILLEFSQPLNLIPPPIRQTLEHAHRLVDYSYMAAEIGCSQDFYSLLPEQIEGVDFTSMLQALPDITTIFCPRLFYLHCGLDGLYNPAFELSSRSDSVPHYQEFLETIYSRLLQDPLASRAVPLIYAMFETPSPQTIAQLLGLTLGELNRSAAMQGLFGVGFRERGGERLKASRSLRVLLRTGRVKLKPSQDSESGHIDDYMGDAHEYLAFSCMKYLPRCAGPEHDSSRDTPGWYAERYWQNHLERAKSSERLYEALRRMDAISIRDIIFRWLEDIPEDTLASWISTREVVPGPPWSLKKNDICLLDWDW